MAPTGKAKSERRPGFPYIEATSARINFKSGLEKKPYALTNADFSLWQDSENSWGVRLKAQPFRTDLTSPSGLPYRGLQREARLLGLQRRRAKIAALIQRRQKRQADAGGSGGSADRFP